MKKTNILFSAAFAVFVTVSCSKDIIDNKDAVQQPNLVPMTFSVAESVEETAPDSKTTLVIVDNKKTINWVANDKVGVFGVVGQPTSETKVNTNNEIFKAGSSGASTTLSGYVANGDNRFYALYPYQKGVSLTFETSTSGSTTALLNNVTIPVQQKAVAGSFDPDAYLFASLSTNKTSFTFYTPCSLVGFQLNDPDVSKIKSIRLYGNKSTDVLASEKGQIKVYGTSSTHVATDGISTYVELVLDGSDKFQNSVQYYFVVRRLKLTGGITIYVEYEDGTVKTRTSSKEFDVSANNCIKSLGTLELDGESFTKLTYSEAYKLGYDVVVGDKVYNISTTPSYNSLDATSTAVNLNTAATSGLYFLKGDKFTLDANWTNIANDIVLIGDTDGVKFSTKKIGTTSTYTTITLNSNSFRIKNVELDVPNTNYLFVNNSTSTDAEALVFDGCKISAACPLLYSSQYTTVDGGSKVGVGYSAKSIMLTNCSIAFIGQCLFNLGYAVNSKIENISISGCTISTSKAARVVTAPSWSDAYINRSIVFTNNTLTNYIPDTAVLYCNGKMNNIIATGNTGSVKLSKNSYLVYFPQAARPNSITAEINNIQVSQLGENTQYTFTKCPSYNE